MENVSVSGTECGEETEESENAEVWFATAVAAVAVDQTDKYCPDPVPLRA